MDRRRALQLAVASLAACVRRARTRPADPAGAYRRAIVIDATTGLPTDPARLAPDAPLGQRGVDDCLASGLTAIGWTLAAPGDDWASAIDSAAWADRQLAARRDALVAVRVADDLRAAKESGRLGVVYGGQYLDFIGDDLARIDALHAAGYRVLQPTYNRASPFGAGCLAPDDTGLTELGRAAIARMEAVGITVDLSHASARTIADGIAAASGPVAISHTGCAALHPHPRNTSDAALRACAARGGVVGIYVMPFLRAAGPPTAADVVRHLEHAIDVAGEDHVGIGTDGDISTVVVDDAYRAWFREFVRLRKEAGIAAPGEDEDAFMFAADLNTPRKLETLAELLSARGHSDARLDKLLGGNVARLFGETWR